MSPRKLTDADKEELLVAYRDTAATTSTLAEKYGVSSSTISRFLKSRLSKEEYEELIQKKRLGRSNSLKKAKAAKAESEEKSPKPKAKSKAAPKKSAPKKKTKKASAKAAVPEPAAETPETESAPEIIAVKTESAEDSEKPTTTTNKKTGRRTRSRRSRPKTEAPKVEEQLSLLPQEEEIESATPKPKKVIDKPVIVETPSDETDGTNEVSSDLLALAEEIKLGNRQEALKSLFDGDYDDDEEDDFDEEDGVDDDRLISSTPVERADEVKILPIDQASFPRTCYVVTDRMSELIARPLKEFNELGQIPEAETGERTLPIFDNHRVAKRFTHGRSQKVIKVPNGKLFLKTSACLAAKGITRVLLDGQVYALSVEAIAENN